MLQLFCWKDCAEQAWTRRIWAQLAVEEAVHGDVTTHIWLKEHNRNRDVPALAHQLHTAVLDADQVEPYSSVVL